MQTEKLAAAAFLRDLDKKNALRTELSQSSALSAGESKLDGDSMNDSMDSGGGSPSGAHFLAKAAMGMMQRS